jgi:hypothetical protein
MASPPQLTKISAASAKQTKSRPVVVRRRISETAKKGTEKRERSQMSDVY